MNTPRFSFLVNGQIEGLVHFKDNAFQSTVLVISVYSFKELGWKSPQVIRFFKIMCYLLGNKATHKQMVFAYKYFENTKKEIELKRRKSFLKERLHGQ